MKTKITVLINLLFFSLATFASSFDTLIIQEDKVIEGVYDGHESYGYNFIITNTDDDSEHTMTFQNIKEELLSQFDLNSEALIGHKFKISYQVKIRKFKDEDGFEDQEEIFTITHLETM